MSKCVNLPHYCYRLSLPKTLSSIKLANLFKIMSSIVHPKKLNTMRKKSLPVYFVTIHYGNQNFH